MPFEEALRRAADEAIAYRKSDGERDPAEIASYAEMLRRFSGEIPEEGSEPGRVLPVPLIEGRVVVVCPHDRCWLVHG